MMRQKQQFEDNQRENKLDKFSVEAPMRSGSLANRNKRADSLQRKSSQQIPSSNVSKPLYEQTYYISSVRDNYLTLISDNMQILELPLGLIRQQIKIGHPIKLRLQYDSRRQQTDDIKFKSLQRDLYKQFHEKARQE